MSCLVEVSLAERAGHVESDPPMNLTDKIMRCRRSAIMRMLETIRTVRKTLEMLLQIRLGTLTPRTDRHSIVLVRNA